MHKFSRIISTITAGIFCVAFASIAQAQATRTWVSGVGDDVNPCSRTAPCKTFAGAMSKTASPGEIDALDPGGYGAVTITKSITIDGGQGQVAGVLASGVQAIVVSALTTDTVIIRNLDINGAGTTLGTNGINIISAKAVYIQHCHIYNFSQNAIVDNRTATQSPAATLFVSDTFIEADNNGIAVNGSSVDGTVATIDHCRIQQNSGFGISGSHGNVVNVLHSIISQNIGEGVKVDTNAVANVVGCFINGNLTGVLNNGSQFMLADTSIFSNITGASGAITSFGNNNVRNNNGGNSLPPPVGQQ